MPDRTVDVTRYENRNGVLSSQVYGWLHGLRVRKNFKSREEAEAAFRRLADAPSSLSFYLDFSLANYRAPDREQSLAGAVTTYLAFNQRERDQQLLSNSPRSTTSATCAA